MEGWREEPVSVSVFAFVGAPGAGKTEAAAVGKELGFPVVTMGEVVRVELRRRGLELSDANAGRVATELRANEGLDAVAKRCVPLVKGVAGERKGVVVVDGIRGVAEVEAFKKEFGDDFVLVRVDAPLRVRYERIQARGRGDDSLSLEEFKNREARERGWGMEEAMKKADKIVQNNGSLEAFRREIKKLFC